ncbi:MAG: ABC-F family ATP-binding cassette domain-containing protein [Bacteroidetes bacterium]|nr:ABC-F family ATP-binding cassette domain-containing protein [Bacteroidota bacterium]
MLVLNNITFEFGSRALFKDTSWHIKPGEKIGLIGRNGTGKSTLLRVISKEYSLSGGEITGRKDMSIGFLNQDLLSYESDDSILEVAMQAFEKELILEKKIEALLVELEHNHDEKLLHNLHDWQHEFEVLGGYDIMHKSASVLEALGFSTEDLKRPLRTFSGGWRMRVMLAKILLCKPDLLLLDEPTNHLDLPSIQWLEQYLTDYDGTFVVVSHDRYFLDKVVTKIAEVANQKITLYSGNYSFYLEEKAGREALQQNRFTNQQKYIKEQERLIERFKAKASKATMAQSRMKMLARLETVDEVESDDAAIRIKFSFDVQPGKIINRLNIKSKRYDSMEIIRNSEIEIEKGDKIALIGANGKGKSTMLRIINNSEPFEGTHEWGYNVVPAFFAQHQLEALNLKNTLMEELQHHAPMETDNTLRGLLGAFLFNGDDVFKKVKVLSGGEKSRVALAKTILTKANFLLLDEPTNHLDMKSVNTLIKVLEDYEGSFVVVSHDRYFLSQIANKIWYIEDKVLKQYPGTYDEFEYYKSQQKQQAAAETVKPAKAAKVVETNNDGDKEKKKQQTKLNNRIKSLDELSAKAKKELQQIIADMSNGDVVSNGEKVKAMAQMMKMKENEIAKIEAEWEDVYTQLMAIEDN